MNISSVSTSASSYNTNNDNGVKQLSNRIKQLESQIEAENKSKDDEKTKQKKIQLLQAQITQIENQLQAKQSSQTITSNEEDTNTILSENKIDIQA